MERGPMLRYLEGPHVENSLFKEMLKMVNKCASERYFTRAKDKNDCDFCPVLLECRELWDNHVVNIGHSSNYYSLERAINRFNQIRVRKKGEDERG